MNRRGSSLVAHDSLRARAGTADASAEGGGDGGTGRFCASVEAAFCADFDGVDYLEGWMLQTAAAASTLEDTASFVSPPRSASISLSLIAGASTYGRLAHVLPGAPLEIVVEARLRLTALPDGSGIIPISLRFGSSANDAMRFETGLRLGGGVLRIFETVHTYPDGGLPQFSGTSFPYGDAGGFDGWTAVRIKLSLDPSNPGVKGIGTFRVGSGPDRTMNLAMNAAKQPPAAPSPVKMSGFTA